MNTEKRVQERINKFRQAREIKLGAIEDAINEQKELVSELSNKMKAIYIKLENEYSSTLDEISGEVENIGSLTSALTDEYDRYYNEYWKIADSLVQYADLDTDIVEEMSSNWADMTDSVNNLQRLVTETLRF
jgi:methyl-accepting chemotaxis protein